MAVVGDVLARVPDDKSGSNADGSERMRGSSRR
jgi:hypothetical protein